MAFRPENERTPAEDADFARALAGLELDVTRLNGETISSIDDALRRLRVFKGQFDKAYYLASKTPTLEDDLEVSSLQDKLLKIILPAKVRAMGLPADQQTALLQFSNAEIHLSRALNSPKVEYSEPQRNAAEAALAQLKKSAAVLETPATKAYLDDLLVDAQTFFDDSDIAKTEPLLKYLNKNNLLDALSEVVPGALKKGNDAVEVAGLVAELKLYADKLSKFTGGGQSKLNAAEENQVNGIIKDIVDIAGRYKGDNNALKELNKLELIAREIQHEQNVAEMDGSRDPKRDYLRPSIIRRIPANMDGLIQMILGSYDSKISRAEAIGRMLAPASPKDRPSRVTAADRTFLQDLLEQLDKEDQRQILQMQDSMDLSNPDNQEYVDQFAGYMDQYLTWINKLLTETDPAIAAAGAGAGGGAPTGAGAEHSIDFVMKNDVASFTPEQLIFDAKLLWSVLFARMELPTSDTKSSYNNKYDIILTELKKRARESTDPVEKDNLAVEARYLQDMRELYQACVIGVSSGATLDYDAVLEGGSGWLGAKIPSQFDEGNIMRLLYGRELRPDLEATNSKEKERIKSVDQILTICSTLLSEYDETAPPPRDLKAARGPFHATQNFTADFQEKFRGQVELDWKVKMLHLPPDQELTSDQKEAISLGMRMMSFLDLRTYFALPFYIAGWSPESGDDIGKTIGKAASRFTGLKDLYLSIGKVEKGFVIPELLIREMPDVIRDWQEQSPKKRNNLLLADYATKLYANFYSYELDEGETDPNARFVYKSKVGSNPVPLNCEVIWLPKVLAADGVTVIELVSDKRSRNGMLKAAGAEDAVLTGPKSTKIPYAGYLNGAAAVEKYVGLCQAAFTLSGDIHKDIDGITGAISKIATGISPTKSLDTLDNRRLANYMYEYSRLSLQAFADKYGKEVGYWKNYIRFLSNLRSGIAGASTAEITIDGEQTPPEFRAIPPEFRAKYGFGPDEKITISKYVLRLIPEGEESRSTGGKVFAEDDIPSSATRDRVEQAVQVDPIMLLNNKEEFEELEGEKENYVDEAKKIVKRAFRAAPFRRGPRAHQLEHHHLFSPNVTLRSPGASGEIDQRIKKHNGHINHELTREEFFRVIVLPPLQGEKKIKEE